MQLGKSCCNSLAKFGNARNGCVMRFALVQPVDTGADYGSGCIEIRFANFEVNNVAALSLQLIRPCEGFKCGFTLNSEHAFGNFTSQFCSHIVLNVARKSKAVSISLVTWRIWTHKIGSGLQVSPTSQMKALATPQKPTAWESQSSGTKTGYTPSRICVRIWDSR